MPGWPTAGPARVAYEAARERAAELAAADQLSEPLADLLRSGAVTPQRDYESARRTVAAAHSRVSELVDADDAIIGPAAPSAAPRGLAATGDPVLSRPWQAVGPGRHGSWSPQRRRSAPGHPGDRAARWRAGGTQQGMLDRTAVGGSSTMTHPARESTAAGPVWSNALRSSDRSATGHDIQAATVT
jgi:hypothetical protein